MEEVYELHLEDKDDEGCCGAPGAPLGRYTTQEKAEAFAEKHAAAVGLTLGVWTFSARGAWHADAVDDGRYYLVQRCTVE